jgi:Xaa-Pro aminopeptidase
MSNDRITRLQSELKKRQLDCLALIPGFNMRYVTGLEFHLMERAVILLIPAEGAPVFVLPTLEQAKVEAASGLDARCFAYPDGQEPSAAVAGAVRALPEIHTLAVEYLRMRVHELRLIQAHLPNIQLSDAGLVMDTLRLAKTGAEVEAMRKAIAITERALQSVVDRVKPGLTEIQVANMLSIAMLEGGGGVLPFEPIVLAGPRGALPHGMQDETAIKPADMLLLDFGTSADGYISDITRTFFVGKPPSGRAAEVYEAVKAANSAGRAAAGPGIPCQEVDRAARKVIDGAGFGQYFIHRVGHGIGMEGHEGPYMVEGNTLPLEVGMTFTVEPGIYIPGEIGVRIEDDMLVTPNGAESLTTFNRDSTVIGV